MNKPCSFSFDLLIGSNIYGYNFSANSKSILCEELTIFKSKNKCEIIYKRTRQAYIDNFDKYYDKETIKKLNFVKNATRCNQLFLSSTVLLNINVFKQIYDWFDKQLIIIRHYDKYSSFYNLFSLNDKFISIVENILYKLDTGISRLAYEDVPFDSKLLPTNVKACLETDLYENKSIFYNGILFLRKNREIHTKKLKIFHTGSNNYETEFGLDEESDGVSKLFGLLPAIFSLHEENRTYIIDDIDQNLHTLLLRKLIENFVSEYSANSNNQLIMTTHDVLLIDPNLFRCDEMWITERNRDGASNLIAFSDYKETSKDKNLQKSYLQGRLGGIPNIIFEETM